MTVDKANITANLGQVSMGRADTARRRRRDQHGIPRLQYCCHVLRGKHSSFGPSPALTKEAFNCNDKVIKPDSSKFNQIQANSTKFK